MRTVSTRDLAARTEAQVIEEAGDARIARGRIMPALALMAAVAIVMGSILALYAGRGENMEDVGQQRLAGLGLVVVGLLLAWLSWAASPVKQALREHRWRQKPI